MNHIASLQSIIRYEFVQQRLLEQALTHRSYSAHHNERLEFVGDSVLNCVAAHLLYQRFPDLPEGELSRARAALVNRDALFAIAQSMAIAPYLRLGAGELSSGGRERPSIQADAVEAIIGAVFIDGGFPVAQTLVCRLLEPVLLQVKPGNAGKDAKSRLQELLQSRRADLPLYEIVSVVGEQHNQTFLMRCMVGKLVTEGQAASRRLAEQAAAEAMLALLETL